MTNGSKIMATAAAAGLAIAPVAAQAGTRAESAPVSVDVQRAAQPGSDQSQLNLRKNPLWLLLLLATIAALIFALTGRSRG